MSNGPKPMVNDLAALDPSGKAGAFDKPSNDDPIPERSQPAAPRRRRGASDTPQTLGSALVVEAAESKFAPDRYVNGIDEDTSRLLEAQQIAPYPIISHLAKRLLAQGAQAVVGHVDRVWGTSFDWSSGDGDQIQTLASACHQILDGGRLGHAMEWINQRYAESSTTLYGFFAGRILNPEDRDLLVRVRKATLDARNYIVVGDPAVRIPGA